MTIRLRCFFWQSYPCQSSKFSFPFWPTRPLLFQPGLLFSRNFPLYLKINDLFPFLLMLSFPSVSCILPFPSSPSHATLLFLSHYLLTIPLPCSFPFTLLLLSSTFFPINCLFHVPATLFSLLVSTKIMFIMFVCREFEISTSVWKKKTYKLLFTF